MLASFLRNMGLRFLGGSFAASGGLPLQEPLARFSTQHLAGLGTSRGVCLKQRLETPLGQGSSATASEAQRPNVIQIICSARTRAGN